jgi:cell division protein FtsZ
MNTDIQALSKSKCPNRLQIGAEVTEGLGCGGDPLVGEKSAASAKDQIKEILEDADMVFLTAGLGGGTGTGATPVIAQMAKEAGVLTVSIMTRPFSFEGPQRMLKAEQGIDKLREYVDTLILVSNDRLLEVVGEKATLLEAFAVTNSVLAQGVQSISDLISVPGLINLDFADVRAIMGERGGAVMGVGQGKGENRAEEAVKKACASPLLDKIEIDGATGVLICITGPNDLRLSEINKATSLVYRAAEENANIIFGAVIDEKLQDEMRVTIIATGFADDFRKLLPEESEERLTSVRSNVSLQAKLRAMFADQEAESEDEVSEVEPEPARSSSEPKPRPRGTVPPPPRFPDTPPPEDHPRSPHTPRPDSERDSQAEPEPAQPRAHINETNQEEIDFEAISMESRREVSGKEPTPQPDMAEDMDLESPAIHRRRRILE